MSSVLCPVQEEIMRMKEVVRELRLRQTLLPPRRDLPLCVLSLSHHALVSASVL